MHIHELVNMERRLKECFQVQTPKIDRVDQKSNVGLDEIYSSPHNRGTTTNSTDTLSADIIVARYNKD